MADNKSNQTKLEFEQEAKIDYQAFKQPGEAEPANKLIEEWVEAEVKKVDDPEDYYGNNYQPGLS